MRHTKPLIDEGRLYRRMPILKRLIPSAHKRITRFLWPNGRVLPTHSVRLVGVDASITHIFGDSHTGLFAASPSVIVHYLGPATMHRVGRDGASIFVDAAKVNQGDALGFIFGEIDVRVHIAMQRTRFARAPDEIIETLVTAYLSTLCRLRDAYVSSPIIAFSVVPPAGYRHPNFNRQMPRNGTDQERVGWTLQLNEALRRGALRAGFGFVDQYTPFANKRGLLDLRRTRDGTHVTPDSIKDDIEVFCISRDDSGERATIS